MKRPITSYILILLTFFQIISAVPAGWSLISDPSGCNLGFSTEMLKNSPFHDFLIPGLFLFIVLGIFPIIIFFVLIKKTKFNLADKINLYKKYHWSWTFSYYLGILLVLWINMQLIFLKEFSIIHFVYSMIGVLIILITLLPSTKEYYRNTS